MAPVVVTAYLGVIAKRRSAGPLVLAVDFLPVPAFVEVLLVLVGGGELGDLVLHVLEDVEARGIFRLWPPVLQYSRLVLEVAHRLNVGFESFTRQPPMSHQLRGILLIFRRLRASWAYGASAAIKAKRRSGCQPYG